VAVLKKDAQGKEVFDKVNEDFLKKTKLDSLSNLFKEKSAKEVIILIEQ
jgi:hypothetical protein